MTSFDEKALQKRLIKPEHAVGLLTEFKAELANLEPFTTENLETCMQDFVAAREMGLGQIIHAVRVAVTGKAVGFGMWETLAILGRERVIKRIDHTLKHLEKHFPNS